MIYGQRRFGAVGATLFLVVLGISCSGSAVAAERPTGKATPDRSLRSTTDPHRFLLTLRPCACG